MRSRLDGPSNKIAGNSPHNATKNHSFGLHFFIEYYGIFDLIKIEILSDKHPLISGFIHWILHESQGVPSHAIEVGVGDYAFFGLNVGPAHLSNLLRFKPKFGLPEGQEGN